MNKASLNYFVEQSEVEIAYHKNKPQSKLACQCLIVHVAAQTLLHGLRLPMVKIQTTPCRFSPAP